MPEVPAIATLASVPGFARGSGRDRHPRWAFEGVGQPCTIGPITDGKWAAHRRFQPNGMVTDVDRAVQAKDGETVVLSGMEWPDTATRDAGPKEAVEDARMKSSGEAMPFDGSRRVFGGFRAVAGEQPPEGEARWPMLKAPRSGTNC